MTTVTTTETATNTAAVAPAVVAVQPASVVVPSTYLAASDRRKGFALFFLAGGGAMMTIYASIVLYLVQEYPRYAYYLGLFAMLNIFMIFTGLVGMFVKRSINVTRNGVIIEDQNGSQDQQS